jgi:hypothetical protein
MFSQKEFKIVKAFFKGENKEFLDKGITIPENNIQEKTDIERKVEPPKFEVIGKEEIITKPVNKTGNNGSSNRKQVIERERYADKINAIIEASNAEANFKSVSKDDKDKVYILHFVVSGKAVTKVGVGNPNQRCKELIRDLLKVRHTVVLDNAHIFHLTGKYTREVVEDGILKYFQERGKALKMKGVSTEFIDNEKRYARNKLGLGTGQYWDYKDSIINKLKQKGAIK